MKFCDAPTLKAYLAKFAFHFQEFANLTVPSDAKVEGFCDHSMSKIVLTWVELGSNEQSNSFALYLSRNSKQFSVYFVEADIYFDEENFPSVRREDLELISATEAFNLRDSLCRCVICFRRGATGPVFIRVKSRYVRRSRGKRDLPMYGSCRGADGKCNRNHKQRYISAVQRTRRHESETRQAFYINDFLSETEMERSTSLSDPRAIYSNCFLGSFASREFNGNLASMSRRERQVIHLYIELIL